MHYSYCMSQEKMQLIARLQAALSEAEASSGSSPAASASPMIPLTSYVPGEAYCAGKKRRKLFA